MRVRDEFGLRIAEVCAQRAVTIARAATAASGPEATHTRASGPEATHSGASGLAGVSLLRVLEPPVDSWPELARVGFVRKPAWITWFAAAPASEAEFLDRLPRKPRQDLHRALGRAQAAGLRVVIQRPIDGELLDTFLALYTDQVAAMDHGVPFARDSRDDILASTRDYAVFAFDRDRLVGGCVCQEDPEHKAVRLRFSAVHPRWRAASLARVLYLWGCRSARDNGYPWVTLGNEPNLYGHVAKPGLFLFKSRLGFRPVPAGRFGAARGGDVADLLLSLDGLADPSLMLGYDGGAPDRPVPAGFRAYVYSRTPQEHLGRYTTEHVRRVELRHPVIG